MTHLCTVASTRVDALIDLAGRLHPLAVHFPIALLLLAAAAECFAHLRRKPPTQVGRVCLLVGAAGSLLSVGTGLLNAQTAGPITGLTETHRNLGFIATGLALIACIPLLSLRSDRISRGTTIWRVLLILVAIGAGITGHWGGSVSRGEGYLEDAIRAVLKPRQPSPKPTGNADSATPAAPTSTDSSQAAPDPDSDTASAGTVVPPPNVRYPADGKIDFIAHVKPILATQCWQCHGETKRKGGLRLDSLTASIKGGKHGTSLIPGNADESALYFRLFDDGVEQQMPLDLPPLSDEHMRILKDWIDQGAVWPESEQRTGGVEEKHWAFVSPTAPKLPAVSDESWVRNDIDRFVMARLDEEDLFPSFEADKATLLRRVSLDLTGLPPSIADLDAFLADPAPDAYERAVDRLLASPAYGERAARTWLDLARYADSRGYEKDHTWSMWPYRDWVVNAFNADMPFDQFTIEQLAGDLLPQATTAQLVATGFHRNSMINEEGGTDAEEARVNTVIDRTNTTATVWLGSTMACAQCHDHKYDPISQSEYFSFYAFFNTAEAELKPRTNSDGENEIVGRVLSFDRPDRTLIEQRIARVDARMAGAPTDTAAQLAATRAALVESLAKQATTQVMQEATPRRETHILERGSFLTPGAVVHASGPAALPPIPPTTDGSEPTRLNLARWLVSKENPLTARVQANRIWAQLFGRGIVETEEDFGTRGSLPSHPQLLDYLATQFMDHGWSMKRLHRLIVTSATYRQSAVISPDLLERDPTNTLLARGPRFRLDAEAIRDSALAVSGLLCSDMGGPSVFPPQPPGIWGHAYNGEQWTPSTGDDRYRRAVYTFIKRATPYTTSVTFDGPSRQVTCTRRPRTNTALQALNTLNDPAFMECAVALARRTLAETSDQSPDSLRLAHMFRLSLCRAPSPDELGRLLSLLTQQRAHYTTTPAAADELVNSFPPPLPTGNQPPPITLAPWAIVGNVILNLDEFLSKP